MAPHATTPPATNGIDAVNGDQEPHLTTWADDLPKRHPETGIDVLIVGAGIGGLTTALECWRKGHNVVRILERSDGPVLTGDIIIIQPSALTAFRHWPGLVRALEDIQIHVGMEYKKHDGKHIYGPCPPSFNDPENSAKRVGPHVAPAQKRGEFYSLLLRQAEHLGIKISYGNRIKDYFEDKLGRKGGVIMEDGSVATANIVVAADGAKTRSAVLVGGEEVTPKPSGMAIYRTSYPKELALKDDTVREMWESEDPVWQFWLGPGMYTGVFLSHDTVCWGFSPKDDGTAEEGWNPDASSEEALKALQRCPGWHPAIPALIRTAPAGSIVHSPLLWRDLRREWTSPGGFVVQVGDAAHAFLPTSGNGATQAMEDGVTLAAALQLGGRRNAALATQTYAALRFERVSCAQKMSFVNSQLKHETDWDAVEADPASIRTRFPNWICNHDPEAYAYENYKPAFDSLVAGSYFHNTNIPPGHKCVPWSVDEVKRDIENGTRVEDLLDGDWS